MPKQLDRNHTSAWVFSCKFAAFSRTPFPKSTSGWLLLFVVNLEPVSHPALVFIKMRASAVQ